MDKKVVIPLHGIRTHAEWQRKFVDFTQYPKYHDVLHCVLDDWSFGHFPLIKFLRRGERNKKIDWFRKQYYLFMNSRNTYLAQGEYPSIVAHSFGTYILGHALEKYSYLKFDKIILCGSILPRTFDWKKIIERGQVREVRNEYGVQDIWVRRAQWFIADAGSSGYDGFAIAHDKLIQEKFLYKHSEYFDKGHMEAFWIPFLLGTPVPDPTRPARLRNRRRLLQLPPITKEQLDMLPVSPKLSIKRISYGDEINQHIVEVDQLYILPDETKFLSNNRVPTNIVELVMRQQGGLDSISKTREVFVPEDVEIIGEKQDDMKNHYAQIYVCTDIPYSATHPNSQGDSSFRATCQIGMGGIAAFVDRYDDLRPCSQFEIGGGIGCVAVILAVAYKGRIPVFKSSGILVIRKGIRFPDDVWLSAQTNRPICSTAGDISKGRFIFQSRESKGASFDIFVADYNGKRMCNLNAGDESAWDGFQDETGREVACWTDDGQIKFCTRSGGLGYGRIVTRPDCLGIGR